VQEQEKQCRELAARLGYVVIKVFCDNDVSAYSGKPRPEYLKIGRAADQVIHRRDRHRHVALAGLLAPVYGTAGVVRPPAPGQRGADQTAPRPARRPAPPRPRGPTR
jgi:hypothetical protein